MMERDLCLWLWSDIRKVLYDEYAKNLLENSRFYGEYTNNLQENWQVW